MKHLFIDKKLPSRILPCLVLAFGLSACGSGSGGSSSGSPSVAVVFPPPTSVTDTDTILVRGTGESLSSVLVNGISATSSDGFANWTASVTLTDGNNNLLVNATPISGGSISNAGSVTVRRAINMLYDPWDADLDNANNRLLVVDSFAKALFAIDMSTGVRTEISGPGVGNGLPLAGPRSVALDLAINRAYVIDLGSVKNINLLNGDRTILSDSSNGGPGITGNAKGLALDNSNNRLLYLDSGQHALYEIDLTTGDRNIISDDSTGTGSGPNLDSPIGLALDTAGGTAYVTSAIPRALIAVDLDTGDRTIVSDSTTMGTGTKLTSPQGVVLDIPGGKAYVVSDGGQDGGLYDFASIIAVDLATGNRTVLSGLSVGSGPDLLRPYTIDWDSVNNRFLVVDNGLDALFSIDDTSGDRTVVSEALNGTGTYFRIVHDIAYDRVNDRAYVTNVDDTTSAVDAVLSIDLTTGNRSVLSGKGTGSGAYNFGIPYAIGLDSANNRVQVTDLGDDVLVGVDITSGDRTVLSGGGMGAGPTLRAPIRINVDSASERTYIYDSTLDALLYADITTGNRITVSDDMTGSGTNFVAVSDFTLDLANSRAFVVDDSSSIRALLSVSLTSGDRMTLSDNATGTGEELGGMPAIALDSRSDQPMILNDSIFSSTASHILAVNPANGDRTIVSGTGFTNPGTTGSGPDFVFATKLDVDDGLALVFDVGGGLDALLMVDLVTGERVIVSK